MQGYFADKKQLLSLEPSQGSTHIPTVASYGGDVSYERGTPVHGGRPGWYYNGLSQVAFASCWFSQPNEWCTFVCGTRVRRIHAFRG